MRHVEKIHEEACARAVQVEIRVTETAPEAQSKGG
jgi:hypothetical protein